MKNHPLLISAFKKLSQTRDARLMMVGQGECEHKHANATWPRGLRQGVLARRDARTRPYYVPQNLRPVVRPRGPPTVVIEAMACGMPIVSTDCPSGPAEILEGGRYGRLVPVGDADAMAKAMMSALRRARRRSLEPPRRGTRARAHDRPV